MAKSFAPRISKKARKVLDMGNKLDADLFKKTDEKLLQGARLEEIQLKNITVKDQVRTKFNDDSIKELGQNIKLNGLIQPLVLHLTRGKYTLICGERRFRAMSTIKKPSCPCFILENKSEQDLMAIQFSENSAREALHYIDKADGILNYQKATKASERKITQALGISKSEVHRSLMIAKLTKRLKEAAKVYNIEKYVLLEFDAMPRSALRTSIEKKILAGEIQKRSQLKRVLSKGGVIASGKAKKRKKPELPTGLSANAFLKAMNAKSKDLPMDTKTKQALKKLLDETIDLVDL